jgi:glycosyltransferase involved in cell wall biosynthesis
MKTDTPFFSIIIPTRNRYETLPHAIRTVLLQDLDSFELIISDNSDPEVCEKEKITETYKSDARIKYYRPPHNMSMSDHWEFAVSKAIGEFIIIFGDDDGLVKGALSNIYNTIKKTNTNLVSWARVEYNWPDRLPKHLANLMVIPYIHRTGMMDGMPYIKKTVHCRADYRYLPMLYNSAVSKNIIKLLKEKTGRVFNASSPDVYTGYAFAYLLKEYICVGQPLSINGVSSKSNGAAQSNNDDSKRDDFWKLGERSEIKWPETIPHFYTSYLGIIEPFVQLSKFFPELSGYISRKEIYKIIIDRIESSSEKDLEKKISMILESAKNDKHLYSWVSAYIAEVKPKNIPETLNSFENIIGFNGSHLTLDGSKFGLENVYDVSIFINDLFGNLKDEDFLKPATLPVFKRIKKAAAIVLRT